MPRQQMHDGMSGGEANSQDILEHHSDPVVLLGQQNGTAATVGDGGVEAHFQPSTRGSQIPALLNASLKSRL